jgi:GntR family negative regulator for fad regulon and positive regulator of fabA
LVVKQLATRHKLSDSPGDFTHFDWQLQYQMTLLSQNAIFTLILNGFKALFLNLAPLYFSLQEARAGSLAYYVNLESAARDANVDQARTLTKAIMEKSIRFWNQVKLT